MKFTASQADLANAIQIAQRAVAARSTLPILTGIRIRAGDGRVDFTATDQETGIECSIPGRVSREGEVVLPSRYLGDIVRKIPFGEIEIEVEEGRTTAQLTWERSRFTIHGFAAADFPSLAPSEGDVTFVVDQEALRLLIRRTAFAVSHDDTRPLLTGVLLQIDGGIARAVATDGMRLAYAEAAVAQAPPQAHQGIVPGRALAELARIAGGDGEKWVKLSLSGRQAAFDLGDVRLVTRLIEGQYPAYRMFVPAEFGVRAELKTQELLDACERAALIARDGGHIIRLDVEPDRVRVSAHTPDVGTVEEEVSAAASGRISILFTARFLLDAVRALEADGAILEFSGEYRPTRVRPAAGDGCYAIVMPVRMS